VIGLLLFGNVFCAVCPFTLSRSVAARWLGRPLRWPAALRGKWLAAGLFVLYLWAYEAFALWDSPWWTAWIVVGYFAASFLVEGLFPRGSFCRYVCPIGQFHFIGAGVSPVEVRALDVRSCARCSTRDCLRGNDASPGCPTGLLLPTKTSSLDCTFCLDCVRACPHQNAGVVPVVPGSTLGASRFGRLDVAALALVFCFGAFANAAAMVAPVAAWERSVASRLGAGSTLPVMTLWLAAALLLAPLVGSFLCTVVARSLGGVEASLRGLATRLAPAMVPVGFAMWLSHFGFHLFAGLGVAPAALTGLEIAALGAGLVVSVAVAWRLALEVAPRPRQALGIAAPWALLATVLYGIGTWIVLQPREMRGMVLSCGGRFSRSRSSRSRWRRHRRARTETSRSRAARRVPFASTSSQRLPRLGSARRSGMCSCAISRAALPCSMQRWSSRCPLRRRPPPRSAERRSSA
jgi:ferredoxin